MQQPARLVLHSLVLENFKSYAGRHVMGPFSRSFSCILGSNGSGKSNSIDAMLFVFGWRAKALRHARLADMIHYSAEHPDCTAARVEVHFELFSDASAAPVADSRFFVARTVSRKSSASQYDINGERCSMEDVREYLLRYGIDLSSSRFLILQGEVEQISLMKPRCPEPLLAKMTDLCRNYVRTLDGAAQPAGLTASQLQRNFQSVECDASFRAHLDGQFADLSPGSDVGLLEFLEGVVGTDRYIPDIAFLTAKLEFLGEQRVAARMRQKVAGASRDELDPARAECVGGLLESVHGVKRLGRLYQAEYYRLSDQHSDSVARQAEMRSTLARVAGEDLRLCEERRAQAEGDLAASTQRAADTAREIDATCTDRLKQLRIEVKVSEERRVQLERDLAGRERAIEQARTELAAVCSAIEGCPAREAELQAEVTALEAQARALSDARVSTDRRAADPAAGGTVEVLQVEIARLERMAAPVSQQLAALASRVSVHEKHAAAKLGDLVGVAARVASNVLLVGHAHDTLQGVTEPLARLRRELADLAAAAAADARSRQARDSLAADARRVHAEVAALEGQLAELAATTTDAASRSHLEDALLAAQSSGALAGIRGRVGDLGYVDASLGLAAAAAFGASLDQIVVDTMADAKAALQFIRQNGLGVASLLNLEQVTARARDRMVPQGEYPPLPRGGTRFLDAVKTSEPDLLPVFWHVMGDTLVAPDGPAAQALSRVNGRRNRVVTTGGELFEASGAITGGGDSSLLLRRFRGFAQAGRAQAGAKAVAAETARLTTALRAKRQELDRLLESRGRLEQGADAADSAALRRAALEASVQGLLWDCEAAVASARRAVAGIFDSCQSAALITFSGSLSSLLTEECAALQTLLATPPAAESMAGYAAALAAAAPSALELCQYYAESLPFVPRVLAQHAGGAKGAPRSLDAALQHEFAAHMQALTADATRAADPAGGAAGAAGAGPLALIRARIALLVSDSCVANLLSFERDLEQEVFADPVIQGVQAEIASLAASQSVYTRELDGLRGQLAALQPAADATRLQLDECSRQLDAAQRALRTHRVDEKKLGPRRARVEAELRELHAAFARAAEQRAAHGPQGPQGTQHLEAEMAHIEGVVLPGLRKALDGHRAEAARLRQELSALDAERQSIADYVSNLQRSIAELAAAADRCAGAMAAAADGVHAVQAYAETVHSVLALGRMDIPRDVVAEVQDANTRRLLADAPQGDGAELATPLSAASANMLREATDNRGMLAAEEACAFSHGDLQSADARAYVVETYCALSIPPKERSALEALLRDGLDVQSAAALLQEHKARAVRALARAVEYAEVLARYDAAKADLSALRSTRQAEFLAAFATINTKLRETYRTLTMGGDAQLELLNQFDPYDGVFFSVMPPRKSWKNITNLSGGEKTLSSLSLIFSLHSFKPCPLYFMDEIDAALDFRNVSIIANFICEATSTAQFIVISLRNNTFELAGKLVGVYKKDNSSRTVVCEPNLIAAKAGI